MKHEPDAMFSKFHRRAYHAYLQCQETEKAEQVRQYVLKHYGIDLSFDIKQPKGSK